MEELVKKAEEFALSEIDNHRLPPKRFFDTSNEKGEELAKHLGADVDVVKIGTRLMDIKLGEAASKGIMEEHVSMGVEATKDFLGQFEISDEIKEKIINCVEGHHGNVDWTCKEAEICANADCYRFHLVSNWLSFIHSMGHNGMSFEESLKAAEFKLEEKWNILSLDYCKKELEPHYKAIREILDKANKNRK